MRVLLFTPYPASSATGVGSFVRMHADGLQRHGVSVEVVGPTDILIRQGLANLILAIRSARGLFGRRGEVDVVHCQQLHLQSLAAGLLGRLLGKGVVLTVHGRSPVPVGLRGFAFRAIERACARTPHRLVYVARALQANLSFDGTVIPNGVPVESIQRLRTSRGATRRELGLGSSLVFVFVGRVTKDKGIPTLLEAFDLARQSTLRDLRLLLVGPVDAELQAAVRGRDDHRTAVIVAGEQPDPWRFLVASDVFVLPSSREGLPISLLEAMAAGLPAIASPVGDVPDLISDGFTGRLTPPGDSRGLADAIEWAALHPSEVARFGEAAFNLVRSRYDLDKCVIAYLRVYAEALRESTAPTERPTATP